MTEAELKDEVLRIAYKNGWSVHHSPARWQRNGGGSGYPDLTCARDGEVVWLELKQQDGKLSHEQTVWQQALPFYHVIRPSDLQGRVLELLG